MGKERESEVWHPRIPPEEIARNFDEVRPPLPGEAAILQAQRCLYCEPDPPCMRGCPTHIDIPGFIRQIADGKPEEAAGTILASNVLGAVCARVCPVETLCERLCICHTLHEQPIPIGRLQRFATDSVLRSGKLPMVRKPATGNSIAVVGAGPAGISGAFELARLGHSVELLDQNPEIGGLDRYGIAEYKIDAESVRHELAFLLQIGGVRLHPASGSVDAARLQSLLDSHDAVLLALGLPGPRTLRIPGESLHGVVDALHFIREVKTMPLDRVRVGKRVVVVGGGNTAVDAATQAKRLGAESVTIVVRRGRGELSCTEHEYELAVHDGCTWQWHTEPVAIEDNGAGWVGGLVVREEGTRQLVLPCDHLIEAIGQHAGSWLKEVPWLLLEANGTLRVDRVTWMTSVRGLFGAGDCVLQAKEVVHAVREGKLAALSIDGWLAGGRPDYY